MSIRHLSSRCTAIRANVRSVSIKLPSGRHTFHSRAGCRSSEGSLFKALPVFASIGALGLWCASKNHAHAEPSSEATSSTSAPSADQEPAPFAGRTFIVTGGSSGVGEAVALALAKGGAAGVTVVGRNEGRGEGVVAKLQALGCDGLFVKASMENVQDVHAIVPAHLAKFSSLHGLVNSAGDTSRGNLATQSVDLWDQLFAVNARAPFILTQASTNYMKEHHIQGGVVNIITITSHGGQPYLNGYAASKAALVGFTKNSAHSLRKDRIRCNGINIGWTASAAEHALQVRETGNENWLDEAKEKVPFGKLVHPSDIAGLVAFLLSDASGVMTGSIIDMDQNVIGAYD